jgi:hypothetical protein
MGSTGPAVVEQEWTDEVRSRPVAVVTGNPPRTRHLCQGLDSSGSPITA